MKIIAVLALSSVFVSGLVVPLSAHEYDNQKKDNASRNIRVVSPPVIGGPEYQGANTTTQSENRTACLPSLSPDDLKSAVEKVLRANPELVMEVLKHQSIELAGLVERGSMMKVVKEENDRRMEELAHPKVADIDIRRPIRGNRDAAITIVEYSDFECPFCEAAHNTIQEVLQQYGKTVRFVYKHNPLSFHALAEPAARYFEAIVLQDPELAWEFHDRVFEEQSELGGQGDNGLKVIASGLVIDQVKLEQDLQSQVVDERLTNDRQEAERFGFDGTPAFLVNGVSLMGNRPLQDFEELIQFAMDESAQASVTKIAEAFQGER